MSNMSNISEINSINTISAAPQELDPVVVELHNVGVITRSEEYTAGTGINISADNEISVVTSDLSYTDLQNKPTIPVVPTNVSAFTNDAGYLTSHQSLAAYRTSADQDVIDASKLPASKCTYQTTAPTAAISDGGVHIVYLTSEPATKYEGYIYMIAEE